MTLQAELCLCPDISTDSKWSTVDLRSLFDSGGLSSLWNDLVRSGELVSNDADLTGTGQFFSYFPNMYSILVIELVKGRNLPCKYLTVCIYVQVSM